MQRTLRLDVPQSYKSSQAIWQYTQLQDARVGVDRVLAKGRKYLAQGYPLNYSNIFSYLRMVGNRNAGAVYSQITPFAAGINPPLMAELDKHMSVKGLDKALGHGIVMVGETMPGCPGSLLFFAKSIRKEYLGVRYLAEDAGVFGLTNATNNKLIAYVVKDPLTMLSMQCNAMLEFDQQPPIVAAIPPNDSRFKDATKASIKALTQKKVIFWDPQETAETFELARRLGERAWIASSPVANSNHPGNAIRNRTVTRFLELMEEGAIPWYKLLIRRLCHDTEDAALYLLEQLEKLDKAEIDLIMANCTEYEKAKLKILLDQNPESHTVDLGGRTYLERPGKGWVRQSIQFKSNDIIEELISDVSIAFKHVHLIDDVVYYSGTLKFKEYPPIAFTADDATLRDSLISFLSKECLSSAADMPTVSPEGLRILVDLCKTAYRPQTVIAPKHIGYDVASQSFVFPQFTVDPQGKVVPHEVPESGRQPADKLYGDGFLPKRSVVERWLKPTPSNEIRWTIFLAILANLTAPAVGAERYGVAVLDSYGVGEQALNDVSASCGLRSWYCMSPKDEDFNRLTQISDRHGLPTLVRKVDTDNYMWQQYLRCGTEENLILNANLKQGIGLSLSGRWLFVDARDKEQYEPEDMKALIAAYLTYFQRNRLACDDKLWAYNVAMHLRKMLLSVYPQLDINPLWKRIAIRMRPWGITGRQADSDKFLDAVSWAINRNIIAIGVANVREDRKTEVQHDVEAGRIRLNTRAIYKVLLAEKMILPDEEILYEHFPSLEAADPIKTDNGWSISEDYFHQRAGAFQALYKN